MPKKLFRPPKNVISEWPEIFEDMYMSTMPLYYTKKMQIKFENGRIWEINVSEILKEVDSDDLASKLVETFNDYRDEIKGIEFEIDIAKLKKDIKKSSKRIL